jgi:hypothetical protein
MQLWRQTNMVHQQPVLRSSLIPVLMMFSGKALQLVHLEQRRRQQLTPASRPAHSLLLGRVLVLLIHAFRVWKARQCLVYQPAHSLQLVKALQLILLKQPMRATPARELSLLLGRGLLLIHLSSPKGARQRLLPWPLVHLVKPAQGEWFMLRQDPAVNPLLGS